MRSVPALYKQYTLYFPVTGMFGVQVNVAVVEDILFSAYTYWLDSTGQPPASVSGVHVPVEVPCGLSTINVSDSGFVANDWSLD